MSQDRWSGLNGINTCNSTRQCRSRAGELRCGDILYEGTRDWLCLSRNFSYSSWAGDATMVVQLAKLSEADNSWYNSCYVCTPLNAAALSKKSPFFSKKSSYLLTPQSRACFTAGCCVLQWSCSVLGLPNCFLQIQHIVWGRAYHDKCSPACLGSLGTTFWQSGMGQREPRHPIAGGTHSSRLRTSLSRSYWNNHRRGASFTTVGNRRCRAPRPRRFTATRLHTCCRRGRRHRLGMTSAVPPPPRPWMWALYAIGSTNTWTRQNTWVRDSKTSTGTRQSTWVGSWVTVGTYDIGGSGVKTSRSNTNNTGWRRSSGHNTSWYGITVYGTWGIRESIGAYASWELSSIDVSLGCLTWKVKPRGSGDPSPHHAYWSMAVGGITWAASRAA